MLAVSIVTGNRSSRLNELRKTVLDGVPVTIKPSTSAVHAVLLVDAMNSGLEDYPPTEKTLVPPKSMSK